MREVFDGLIGLRGPFDFCMGGDPVEKWSIQFIKIRCCSEGKQEH